MKNRICVDAGPVVHLVAFPEKEAVRRAWEQWEEEGISIVAPALLHYEVTNVLHRYHRFGVLSELTMKAALSAALTLPISLVEDGDLHLRAAEIAIEFDLNAAYDAHYLALAERFEAEMWTTDQKLLNQMQSLGIDWVRLMPSEQ